jgi:tetratricopeptide (TPR) repeat protein
MADDMKQLRPPDILHLQAAQGWLELGNHAEANAELEKITPQLRAHPDVLQVRRAIYAAAEKWEPAVEVARTIAQVLPDSPFGWIHWAFGLHELKRTEEARSVLLPVLDRFRTEYLMRYNLACYACQLGNLKEAWRWLEKAIDMAVCLSVARGFWNACYPNRQLPLYLGKLDDAQHIKIAEQRVKTEIEEVQAK